MLLTSCKVNNYFWKQVCIVAKKAVKMMKRNDCSIFLQVTLFFLWKATFAVACKKSVNRYQQVINSYQQSY